jgi:hypothetical protein
MLTVHKFQFDTDGLSTDMARPIKPLHVDIQNGKLCLWMLVDTEVKTNVDIIVTDTGHPVRSHWTPCGTVIDPPFVWHIWIPRNQFGIRK